MIGEKHFVTSTCRVQATQSPCQSPTRQWTARSTCPMVRPYSSFATGTRRSFSVLSRRMAPAVIPQLLRSLATLARRQALLLVSSALRRLLSTMESCNQWIIEMLERDDPPPPSWASAVVELEDDNDDELDEEPMSTQLLPAAWESAASPLTATTEGEASPVALFGTSSESTDLDNDEAERESTDGGLEDDELDESLKEKEIVSASDVGTLKAACEFYIMRCDQLRDTLRRLSAELVETRGVLARRLELERMRRSPSSAINQLAVPLAHALMTIWRSKTEAAGSCGDTKVTLSSDETRVEGVNKVAPSAEQSATVVIGFDASDIYNSDTSNTTSAVPVPKEDTHGSTARNSGDFEVTSTTITKPAPSVALPAEGAQPHSQEVVVAINPKGTSYRQLTQLPVKRDDGSWHRHILRLLSAERELRRQQHRNGKLGSDSQNASPTRAASSTT